MPIWIPYLLGLMSGAALMLSVIMVMLMIQGD
jgi:hypothetical protein